MRLADGLRGEIDRLVFELLLGSVTSGTLSSSCSAISVLFAPQLSGEGKVAQKRIRYEARKGSAVESSRCSILARDVRGTPATQNEVSERLMKYSPLVIELMDERVTVRGGLGRDILESREIIQPAVKPVVKWAGGKQWLAPAAPHLIPKKFSGRYFEPFLGGGAFFFAVEPAHATLSDRNQALISSYDTLRNDTNGIIRLLRGYPHDEDFYYRLRARSPRTERSIAARIFYLNRTCWNGLYRVNREGEFNTPFGRYKNPTICDPNRLRQAARLLRRAKLLSGDFEATAAEAKAGDFVYFDPPYITGHKNNGFLKYNASLFSWDDQRRLARFAAGLADSGANVLVSNADYSAVVDLYKGFYYYRVTRNSLIGGGGASRREVDEALLSSYPLLGCQSEVI